MVKLLSCSGTSELSKTVAAATGTEIVSKTVKKFPDGETYVRLEDTDFKGEKVFIFQSLYPDPNNSLIELFMTINAVRENGGRAFLVIPYFAYGRQDRIFEKGEAFSLKMVADILKSLGAEKLITIDPHFYRKAGDFDFFGMPARNISAVSLLVEHARKTIGGGFIAVGPDRGSKDFLAPLDGSVFMKKTKRFLPSDGPERKYEISIELPENISGRNVLLMDDIIASGGTIRKSAKILKQAGNRVFVACTHGIFLGGSLEELKKYADEIISTDTVKSACSKVSVAGIISEEIKKIIGIT